VFYSGTIAAMDELRQATIWQQLLVLVIALLIPAIGLLHLKDLLKRRNRFDSQGVALALPRRTFHFFVGISFLVIGVAAVGCLFYLLA
jgi:hypothetical protein